MDKRTCIPVFGFLTLLYLYILEERSSHSWSGDSLLVEMRWLSVGAENDVIVFPCKFFNVNFCTVTIRRSGDEPRWVAPETRWVAYGAEIE